MFLGRRVTGFNQRAYLLLKQLRIQPAKKASDYALCSSGGQSSNNMDDFGASHGIPRFS
jgi:hypothetical protein